MRKLVIAAALGVFAIGTAAGCATATPPAGGQTETSPPVSTDDVTVKVCTEAVTYNTTAWTNILAKVTEIKAAIAAQDSAKLEQLSTEGEKLSADWEAKLNELIAKGPKDAVKKELTDMVALVKDETMNEQQYLAAYTKETQELTAACAA